MANLYSTTPSVKKKDVLDVVQSKAQGYQQKYNFITVELPASAWTKVEDPDSQLFGGYTQTVKTDAEGTAIAFEENDVVLVDADDVNAERLADYNVCAEVFDDGLVFYCDGTATEEPEKEYTAYLLKFNFDYVFGTEGTDSPESDYYHGEHTFNYTYSRPLTTFKVKYAIPGDARNGFMSVEDFQNESCTSATVDSEGIVTAVYTIEPTSEYKTLSIASRDNYSKLTINYRLGAEDATEGSDRAPYYEVTEVMDAPTENIIADVVVFPYSGATKMATPSIVEVLDNIETLLDGKY